MVPPAETCSSASSTGPLWAFFDGGESPLHLLERAFAGCERGQDPIGRREILARRPLARGHQREQPGGFGGLEAQRGIFQSHAIGGRQAQLAQHEMVDIRGRFLARRRAAGAHDGEAPNRPGAERGAEERLDVGERGGGGDRQLEAGAFGRLQQALDAFAEAALAPSSIELRVDRGLGLVDFGDPGR